MLRGLLIAAAVVVAVGAFTTYQAFKARSAMHTASDRLTTLSDAAAAGDPGAARQAMFDAQVATESARRNTSGPVWWLASKVPVVGDDITAVRTVINVADEVTQGILPDLIDASESLAPDDLQPTDGRIALAGIRDVSPALTEADDRLAVQVERIHAIDTSSLMSQVANPVSELRAKLDDAHTVTQRISLAAQLLPTMLGGDRQQRTYLVMFQNNAEVRAGGGIPGAMAVVEAKNGKVRLTKQASLSDLPGFRGPVLPLTQAEEKPVRPQPRPVRRRRHVHPGLRAQRRAAARDVAARHRTGRRRGDLRRPGGHVLPAERHRPGHARRRHSS